jgi:hypothetical protein
MTLDARSKRTVMIKLDQQLYYRLRAIIFNTGRDRTIQNLCSEAIRRMVIDIEALENGGRFYSIPDEQFAPAPKGKRRK